MTKSENEGGFVSHLTELRKRLIHSFIFLFIFFIGCYFFSEHLYGFLVEPFAKAVNESGTDRRLIFTALQETFLTYLKVSFFAAFFVTCPYILVQIWKFIAPGLYKHEKIAIVPYLVLTPILFFSRRNACLLFNNATSHKVFSLFRKHRGFNRITHPIGSKS